MQTRLLVPVLVLLLAAASACTASTEPTRPAGDPAQANPEAPRLLEAAEAEEACVAACAPDPEGGPADALAVAQDAHDSCMEECTQTVTNQPEACGLCLAGEYGWEGGCNDRECISYIFTPADGDCAEACPGDASTP